MYVPKHFAADDADVRQLLDNHGAADLITVTEQGLLAALLPLRHEPGRDDQGSADAVQAARHG